MTSKIYKNKVSFRDLGNFSVSHFPNHPAYTSDPEILTGEDFEDTEKNDIEKGETRINNKIFGEARKSKKASANDISGSRRREGEREDGGEEEGEEEITVEEEEEEEEEDEREEIMAVDEISKKEKIGEKIEKRGLNQKTKKIFRPDVMLVDGINDQFANKNFEALEKVYPPYALRPNRDDMDRLIDYNTQKVVNSLRIAQEPLMRFVCMVSAITGTDSSRFIDIPPVGYKSSDYPYEYKAGSRMDDMFGSSVANRPYQSFLSLDVRPTTSGGIGTLPNNNKKRKLNEGGGVYEGGGNPEEDLSNESYRFGSTGASNASSYYRPAPQFGGGPPQLKSKYFTNKWLKSFLEFEEAKNAFGPAMSNRIEDYTNREAQVHLESWLRKPDVMGVIQIKDMLRGAMDNCLDVIYTNHPHLEGVPLKYFICDPLARSKFATVVGGSLFFSGCLRGNRTIFQKNIVWSQDMIKGAVYEFKFLSFNKNTRKFYKTTSAPTSNRLLTGVGFM